MHLLAQAGVEVTVEQRRVESDVAAQSERFLGSPTLRVDGVDVDPGAARRTDYGLEVPLYPTDEGLRGAPRTGGCWVRSRAGRGRELRRVFALVLTGPPGAGKTSVLEALSDRSATRVPHAMVETEALTAAHPALSDEQWLAPVEASAGFTGGPATRCCSSPPPSRATPTFGPAGRVGADAHAVVRLDAEPATLARRIIDREPEGWSELDELVAPRRG